MIQINFPFLLHVHTGSERSRKCVYTTFMFIERNSRGCFQRTATRSNVPLYWDRALIPATPTAGDNFYGWRDNI